MLAETQEVTAAAAELQQFAIGLGRMLISAPAQPFSLAHRMMMRGMCMVSLNELEERVLALAKALRPGENVTLKTPFPLASDTPACARDAFGYAINVLELLDQLMGRLQAEGPDDPPVIVARVDQMPAGVPEGVEMFLMPAQVDPADA